MRHRHLCKNPSSAIGSAFNKTNPHQNYTYTFLKVFMKFRNPDET